MGRTIIVGDLHGCSDELHRLLKYVGFSSGDRLVSVGDLIARGPDPRGVIERVREVGGLAVRGNHEDRLLRFHEAGQGRAKPTLGPTHRATAEALRKRDWAWLASLPLYLDLPEHGVRVVHAGLVPGVAIEAQAPRTLMYIRSIGGSGEAIEERGRAPWATSYVGPPHVVFGHNAQAKPQVHPWATGIDTGAVYGGRLTAMVLRRGEAPPSVADRESTLVSVPSRRVYFAK